MEIRLNVDEEFVKDLSKKLGEGKAATITRDALTLLNWAANEVKQGRVILSSNAQGEDVKQLAMPALDKIKSKRD